MFASNTVGPLPPQRVGQGDTTPQDPSRSGPRRRTGLDLRPPQLPNGSENLPRRNASAPPRLVRGGSSPTPPTPPIGEASGRGMTSVRGETRFAAGGAGKPGRRQAQNKGPGWGPAPGVVSVHPAGRARHSRNAGLRGGVGMTRSLPHKEPNDSG